MAIFPVVLCGGTGTRLWPASTTRQPKQFLNLLGERSLFQETILRLRGLAGAAAPLVVTGEAYLAALRGQLAEIGAEAEILIEPEGRDSAPAVAAAALWAAARDPAAVMAIFACDHHIPDTAAFQASVLAAAGAAAEGAIVAFGVRPTGPATAYGYIEAGEPLAGAPGPRRIARYVEKPDAERARAYVRAGYLWNSGNFVAGARTLLDETARHAPAVESAVRAAFAEARGEPGVTRLGPSFGGAAKISIDHAVMEKTDRGAVLAIDYAWSDLGTWDAIWDASEADAGGNAVRGAAVVESSQGCLIRVAPGAQLIAVGLTDLVVVAENGRVLVCHRAASPDLKAALARLAGLAIEPEG